MNIAENTLQELKNSSVTTVNYSYKNKKIVEIKITIEKYPTHVILYEYKTDRGKKPKGSINTTKINGQNFYNGKIAKHNRNIVMQELHNLYYTGLVGHKNKLKKAIDTLLPLNISMDWYTIPNHETIKVVKSKLLAGVVDPNVTYNPPFDCINQFPYFKAFEDTLVSNLKVIPDDSVKYVSSTGKITFHPVDDFSKRKLVFTITGHPDTFKDTWMRFFKFWK